MKEGEGEGFGLDEGSGSTMKEGEGEGFGLDEGSGSTMKEGEGEGVGLEGGSGSSTPREVGDGDGDTADVDESGLLAADVVTSYICSHPVAERIASPERTSLLADFLLKEFIFKFPLKHSTSVVHKISSEEVIPHCMFFDPRLPTVSFLTVA
jgi:hypothetical protein